MKQIKPLKIWSNGQEKTAAVLDASIINDDLKTTSVFYWQLKEADQEEQSGQILANGNVTMSGQDYENWNGGNDYAYQFIASQINVALVEE